jgi:hypothetical protein
MTDQPQLDLTSEPTVAAPLKLLLLEMLGSGHQPSAWELVDIVEENFGPKAPLELQDVLSTITEDTSLRRATRDFAESLLKSDDLIDALRGDEAPKKEIISSIDSLLRQSAAYRTTEDFKEMVGFMGKFRDYAPFNNMLVRLQNPTCSFYATERDWRSRFNRTLIEDARPMLILAPMHPVMCVYDLDQTEGPELPKEIDEFAKFEGEFEPAYLTLTVENAAVRDGIRIDFKRLSSTNAGFATFARGPDGWKMRIAIHDELDLPSRFGVVCHELAHIYLGHLGSDKDHWWPSRRNLGRSVSEIEAESVAFIVSARLGLQGSSPKYVSRHTGTGSIPPAVSLDLIAKVAGRVEGMTQRRLPARWNAGANRSERKNEFSDRS